MVDIEKMLDNPSDQLIGYAEEAADAVKKISKKFDFDESLSLLIAQTAVEAMKVDCEQHKLMAYSERLDDLTEVLSDAALELRRFVDNFGGWHDR